MRFHHLFILIFAGILAVSIIQGIRLPLWAVVSERDEIGPNLVPDYLTSVKKGAFYGWLCSYWGRM